MSNTNFVIDDGSKRFTFENNAGEVFAEFTFNPTDSGILTRYDSIADFFSTYKLETEDTDESWIEEIKKLDENIKEQFNKLMNKDVSSTLFKTYSPCTIFADGDFFCEKVLEVVGTIIEQEMNVRIAKKAAKIKKATAKYSN